MQTWEAARLETAAAWEKDAGTQDERREIIGAVEATFLERMRLVCLELPTGYVLLEEVAEDRTSTLWKALIEARLQALGAGGRDLGSARAKALLQLAAQGFECLSMPDFFHVLHALRTGYALAIGQRRPQAQKQLEGAKQAWASHCARTPVTSARLQAQAAVEVRQAEGRRWAEGHRTYRQHLATLLCILHPCPLHDATPQTAAQGHNRLHAEVDARAT
jgi:hypothetical protein